MDLGYETDYSYKGYGEHMKNAAGFDMEIYYKLPLRTRLYDKNMKLMCWRPRLFGADINM